MHQSIISIRQEREESREERQFWRTKKWVLSLEMKGLLCVQQQAVSFIALEQRQRRAGLPIDVRVLEIKRAEVWDDLVDESGNVSEQLIRRLAFQDGFESEERDFILNTQSVEWKVASRDPWELEWCADTTLKIDVIVKYWESERIENRVGQLELEQIVFLLTKRQKKKINNLNITFIWQNRYLPSCSVQIWILWSREVSAIWSRQSTSLIEKLSRNLVAEWSTTTSHKTWSPWLFK